MLSIEDVKLVEQIIRICQTRGAFRPEEMISIGTLYDKVAKLIQEKSSPTDAGMGVNQVTPNYLPYQPERKSYS